LRGDDRKQTSLNAREPSSTKKKHVRKSPGRKKGMKGGERLLNKERGNAIDIKRAGGIHRVYPIQQKGNVPF